MHKLSQQAITETAATIAMSAFETMAQTGAEAYVRDYAAHVAAIQELVETRESAEQTPISRGDAAKFGAISAQAAQLAQRLAKARYETAEGQALGTYILRAADATHRAYATAQTFTQDADPTTYNRYHDHRDEATAMLSVVFETYESLETLRNGLRDAIERTVAMDDPHKFAMDACRRFTVALGLVH